eukprot:jgi/Chrzof1/9152/Cz03g37240.t1
MLLSTASCPFHQLAGLPLDLRRSTTRQRHAVRLLPCTACRGQGCTCTAVHPRRVDDYSGLGLPGLNRQRLVQKPQDVQQPRWPANQPVEERRGLHVNVADLLDALQYAAKIKHQVSLTQLNAMLTEVQPQLPSFTTPQLVEAVRCLGAVCVEPEEGFMQQVLDKLQPQLAQLGISQLANLSWGLSRLGPPHQLTDQWLQLYVEAVAAQVHQLPAGMGNKQLARQLAVMLLLPAKCGCTPSQSWLQQYQQAVAGCLAKASTQDIADYLSCLTRLGMTEGTQVVQACLELIRGELSLYDFQQLTQIAYALATCGHELEWIREFENAIQAAQDMVDEVSPIDEEVMAWALSRLRRQVAAGS